MPCKRCGASTKTKRSWQQYCSDRCRWQDWNARHPRNARSLDADLSDPCYYCGVIADTKDHVPPLSVRSRLITLGIDRWTFVEVPACRECNNALGARSLFTLTERKRYMKAWLLRRYKRYLNLPEWTDAELGRMGPTLQSHVLQQIIIADVTRKRLAF